MNSTCLLRLQSGGEQFRSTLVASTSFIHLSAQLVKATCETLSPLLVKRRKKLSLIAAGVESPDRTGPTIADEEAEV